MKASDIWAKSGETYSTTLQQVRQAGGEKKTTLPGTALRIADVEWTVKQESSGATALVKKLPAVPARTFVIRER